MKAGITVRVVMFKIIHITEKYLKSTNLKEKKANIETKEWFNANKN